MSNMLNIGTQEGFSGASLTLVHQTTQRLPNPLYGFGSGEARWKAGYTESTGYRTVSTYTGSYAELCAMAQQMHDAMTPGGDTQVTWEVSQTEGPVGELRVTSEVFRVPFEESSGSGSAGDNEKEDDTTSSMPGDDASYPEISIQSNTVEEPLLTHPNYKDVTDDQLTGLHALINGASEGDIITTASGKKAKVGELVKGCKAVAKIKKGITHYLCAHTVVTIRHKGRSTVGTAGKVGHTSGLPKLPTGMSWLCLGTGAEKCGPECYVTSVWESGFWDKDIYKG